MDQKLGNQALMVMVTDGLEIGLFLRVTSTKGSRPESIMSVHELDDHPPQHISKQVHEVKLYKTTWQYKHF
ncbi:unnamed protein product [Camellia sinensis]